MSLSISLISDAWGQVWTWECSCGGAARREWETECEAVSAQMAHVRRSHREWWRASR